MDKIKDDLLRSPETHTLSERSLLFSKGILRAEGCDVAVCTGNKLAVVDGVGNGNDPNSRRKAEELAQRLINTGPNQIGDHSEAFTYCTQPNISVPIIEGVSRSGGYVIAWDNPEDTLDIYSLKPRVIYNGRDIADAPLTRWTIENKGPITYAAVFTDGGLELMRFLQIFTDGNNEWTPDATRYINNIKQVTAQQDITDSQVLSTIKYFTWYLSVLINPYIPLGQSSLNRQLRGLQLEDNDDLFDDCTMALLEMRNPSHPSFL